MSLIIEKFVSENLVSTEDCWDYISSNEMYALFNQWCKTNHLRNCSKTSFTIAMKKIPNIVYERLREPKKRENPIRVYRYIKQRDIVEEVVEEAAEELKQ